MNLPSLSKILYSGIPLQLFAVKRVAQPKAATQTLFLITIVAYLAGLATFASLMVTQSSSYSTETIIQTSDISNSEWSCSMASVVTQSVTLNSTSEPSETYNLQSINELGNQCLSNLRSVNPCGNESSMLFTPENVDTSYQMLLISTSPVALIDSNTFYFAAYSSPSSIHLLPYKYEMASGQLSVGDLGTSTEYVYPETYEAQYRINSVAMSKAGYGLFISRYFRGIGIMSFDGSAVLDLSDLCPLLSCVGVAITNDNYYNVYGLATTNTSSSEGPYRNTILYIYEDSYEVLLQFDTLEFVYNFAVYSESEVTPSLDIVYIYYVNFDGLYVYHNGATIQLATNLVGYDDNGETYGVGTIQLSQTQNAVYYSLSLQNTNTSNIYLVPFNGPSVLVVSNVENFNGFPVTQPVFNDSQFVYNIETDSSYLLSVFDIDTAQSSVISSGYSGSVSGWYTCGDKLVTTELPENLYSSADCSGNGVSWELQYNDEYFATEEAFSASARALAYAQCNASLYNTICDRVGSLPPYICSRKQYLPFFTVFATAIANAHLLTVVLVGVAGVMLTINKAKQKVVSQASTNPEVKDLEMNPIVQQ